MGALEGRHALVTGAGSGIGAAVAAALASEGATLTLVGRDRDALERRAIDLGVAAVLPCDVTDEAAVRRVGESAGDVDVLVNCAGAAESSPLARTSLDLVGRMLSVNLTGSFLFCRELMPAMVERGFGRVVNIASTAGLRGYPYAAAYCASKHAVVGLTRALALEFAPSGVTVNAVCPGYTETPLLARAVEGIVAATGRDAEGTRRELLRENRFGRFIEPDEVASGVTWLCLPTQAAITGHCLVVAGAEVA